MSKDHLDLEVKRAFTHFLKPCFISESMSFGDNLKRERKRARLKQSDIADALEVTVQAVSAWERNLNEPEFGRVVRIAELLGVSLDALTDDVGSIETLLPQQVWRAPLLNSVAAGAWASIIDASERPPVERSFEVSERPVGEVFALEVEGQSMRPDFRDGDIIIIDTGVAPDPGDFVVAQLDGEPKATFKRYRLRGYDEDGQPIVELAPINPDYPTLVMDAKRPGRIIGTMIEHRRKRR